MSGQIFILENLNCAHCASKIEEKINTLPQIQSAVFTFATKKLVVKSSSKTNELIKILQETCDSIEDGVTVKIEEKQVKTKQKKMLPKKDIITLASGVVFFVLAIVCENLITSAEFNIPAFVLFVVAYLIFGGEILLKAGKNILKGQVFDENFLMSIATLGAFAIQDFPEAVGVMLFFRIGELFEKIAVEKSRSQIMSAVDMRPEIINLVGENTITEIPAENAKAGDIVLVRPGDRIPLDGTVIDGESRIDTSAVTGESVPIKVSEGSAVLSGCVNTSNVIKIRVDKPLSESMVTRILDSVENAAASKPKIDNFITRFARIYTPIVVAVAVFTAVVIPLATGQDFMKWIYTALSFLIMSCPCALVLSVPLAFFSGIGAGSKKGILFKGGISIEALAGVKAVVMDKTGTITKGSFEVQHIITDNMQENELLQLCASSEQASTHPIAKSIVEYANMQNIEIVSTDKIEEISGKGIRAEVNGKIVLCGNISLLESCNVDLKNYDNTLAGTQVLVAVDGIYIGCIVIADNIKEDADKAIKKIKSQRIFTAMLTGDEEKTANEVARLTKIDEVHAKLLPQDKLSILQKIRKEHGSVMFVGDGINDAPVLAGADVGAAMGSGADAAIEAADVVFMNSDIGAVPQAIELSKKTTAISRQNVIFALAIKIIVMILGITGIYSNMWLAVFADTGVAMLCILNSVRLLFKYRK
ncbi:MAG: heavy metal translocating P-type ATPase [Acutalibacteraceae bacterium]|nr:heavy metal translocating P-type ATPase [Acutalibacteraceae bacterium]